MRLRLEHNIFFLVILCLVYSCSQKKSIQSPLFETLKSDQTGLNFTNKLVPTSDFNLFSYMYYYNGSGIGAGDFNNDGKIDLFFAANQGNDKLFLNEGNLKFKDVTSETNIIQDSGWSTGVSVVDINNDGFLDIYICRVSHFKYLHALNKLMVCKGITKAGIPFYEDEAAQYGLNFEGFSTQALFFDYDNDGDLDMFLLNHPISHEGNYAPRKNFMNTYDSLSGQKLFRNDFYVNNIKTSTPRFIDVTKESGINGNKIGYGLGVVAADLNLDGWMDFYVGNDFHENDYLYINQKNGTFKDESAAELMHTSKFTMGVDAADINNDAYPDIISMDMLPYDPYILRRALTEDDYSIFKQKINYGYSYQYSRNNLQLNRRNGMYSEVGEYAGLSSTDWSWSSVWLDFDNDGKKDLFVSNGIPKRMNDLDYINYVSGDEFQQKLKSNQVQEKDIALINKFPEIKVPNRFFKNAGDAVFTDVTDSVINNDISFSNGAVYADLDNDGDLDVITNNIDDKVFLYKNLVKEKKQSPSVIVKLNGAANNVNAIGAKIILFCGEQIQTYENTPVHGFQSSMQIPMLIGLDKVKIDSAFLVWPGNGFQKISLDTNKHYTYTYSENLPKFDYTLLTNFYPQTIRPFIDITASTGLNYVHTENFFDEFNREPLIPHMISTEGPALAIADINHDGLDDIFIGASKSYHNAVYIQQPGGHFKKLNEPDMLKDSMWENVNAIWTDVNNDKNPDLVLASGGNEYFGNDKHLLPLLYLNDGNGNLTAKADAFAGIFVTQSSISAFDFNNDGHQDLFIGGRAQPWNYGKIPRSYLLENDGAGKFKDVTETYCKELLYPGMVTSALLFDMNADGLKDLVACYEWGGIDVFINEKTKFTRKNICSENGWWNSLLIYDINQDGKPDIIAGNLGLNNKLRASDKQPVSLYFSDFDDNGKNEQVLLYYINGVEIPFSSKQALEKQLPYLKKKFLYAKDFAKADVNKLFGSDKIKASSKLTATNFANSIFINKGNLQFEQRALPYQAQFSTLRDAVIVNLNKDSFPDIVMMGNYYDNSVDIGRNDADFGTALINKGDGNFSASSLNNLVIKNQVRHIQPIVINNKPAFVIAKNNDSVIVVQQQ